MRKVQLQLIQELYERRGIPPTEEETVCLASLAEILTGPGHFY